MTFTANPQDQIKFIFWPGFHLIYYQSIDIFSISVTLLAGCEHDDWSSF
jgi:hypothetical protein